MTKIPLWFLSLRLLCRSFSVASLQLSDLLCQFYDSQRRAHECVAIDVAVAVAVATADAAGADVVVAANAVTSVALGCS